MALFLERGKRAFPEYQRHFAAGANASDWGEYRQVLRIPWPASPRQGQLTAHFRGDCFEVAFFCPGLRGPAEWQIFGSPHDDSSLVAATLRWLADFFSGKIVVVVERYRRWWFSPYHLAFFRAAARQPFGKRVVRVMAWQRQSGR